MTDGLLLSFAADGWWSEHGFVIVQNSFLQDDGYWSAGDGAGVVAGPGWVRVDGGQTSLTVDLRVTARLAHDGEVRPGAGLESVDDTVSVADPQGGFSVAWPLPDGWYGVTAGFQRLPDDVDDGVPLPHAAWEITLIRFPLM